MIRYFLTFKHALVWSVAGAISLSHGLIVPASDNDLVIHIKRLDRDYIEHRALAIDKKVQRHRLMAIGINGILIASQTLQLVNLCKACFGPKPMPSALVVESATEDISLGQPVVMVTDTTPSVPVTEKIANFFGAAKKGLVAMPGNLKDSIVSGRMIKGILYTMRELGMYFTMQVMVDLFLSSVHHNDDLTWFVRHHAAYAHTVDLSQDYLVSLMSAVSPDPTNISFYRTSLIQMCNEIVSDTQEVLAFMEHKIKRLTLPAQTASTIIVNYIFSHTNNWAEQVENVLQQENPEYVQLQKLLDALKYDLNRECKQFAKLEKYISKKRLLEF